MKPIILLDEKDKELIYDTSLIGYIECTINELKEKIGNPQVELRDKPRDTNFEWQCGFYDDNNNFIVFTLYDYKNKTILEDDEMYEFHIGGNPKYTQLIRKTLREAIFCQF